MSLFCLSSSVHLLLSPSRPIQSGSRRSNFANTARRQQQQQQQQQNRANSMMQPQHGGHGQQEPLPSHCVSPMSQGGPGGVSQPVPDPHQVGRKNRVPGATADIILCVNSGFVALSECVELASVPAGTSQLSVLPEQPAEHEELILQTRLLLQRHPFLLLLPAPAPGA